MEYVLYLDICLYWLMKRKNFLIYIRHGWWSKSNGMIFCKCNHIDKADKLSLGSWNASCGTFQIRRKWMRFQRRHFPGSLPLFALHPLWCNAVSCPRRPLQCWHPNQRPAVWRHFTFILFFSIQASFRAPRISNIHQFFTSLSTLSLSLPACILSPVLILVRYKDYIFE